MQKCAYFFTSVYEEVWNAKYAVLFSFLGLLRKSYWHLDGRVPSLCLCCITGICSSQLCFTAAQGVSEASKKAKKTKQGIVALYSRCPTLPWQHIWHIGWFLTSVLALNGQCRYNVDFLWFILWEGVENYLLALFTVHKDINKCQ